MKLINIFITLILLISCTVNEKNESKTTQSKQIDEVNSLQDYLIDSLNHRQLYEVCKIAISNKHKIIEKNYLNVRVIEYEGDSTQSQLSPLIHISIDPNNKIDEIPSIISNLKPKYVVVSEEHVQIMIKPRKLSLGAYFGDYPFYKVEDSTRIKLLDSLWLYRY